MTSGAKGEVIAGGTAKRAVLAKTSGGVEEHSILAVEAVSRIADNAACCNIATS